MKHKNAYGLTLIELLIASSIFAIILLSIYSAFNTGIFSYNRIDSALRAYQTARSILNRLELDLLNSFKYTEEDSRFFGAESSIEFFSIVDSYRQGQAYENLCRIKYELSAESLKRTRSQDLDAFINDPGLAADELSSDVKNIVFEYAHRTENPDHPYDWQEIWPADDTQKILLPLAVRIKLTIIERDRFQQESGTVEFTKTVPLPLGG